jgi:hypothetical protein
LRLCAAASLFLLPDVAVHDSARAADATPTEPRKLPMSFTWHIAKPGQCEPDCRDWIAAVGIITTDTPAQFAKIAVGHDLKNATVVLDSSGGSVLDALSLGRTWRDDGLRTTVGSVIARDNGQGPERAIKPNAACESMCVFLLLGGATRYVPPEAHVRVHQIWMGDRANDAKAASYSAQDMMIVERDVGRLAKYTFDMGGTGDLLSLALSVPPWEPLHELSRDELCTANLVTDDAMASADGQKNDGMKVAAKPIQDRVAAEIATPATAPTTATTSTKTAEALPPTGGSAAAEPAH